MNKGYISQLADPYRDRPADPSVRTHVRRVEVPGLGPEGAVYVAMAPDASMVVEAPAQDATARAAA